MRKIFFILFFLLLQLTPVSAWLFISEVFPNTVDDKNLEYIQIINTWEDILDISLYALEDKSWKRYVFPDNELLKSGEKKKYLRPDTKLVLNNSNEELFIYDNQDQLIGEFSYKSSLKSEPILNEDIPNHNETVDDTWDIDIPMIWEDINPLLSWIIDSEVIEHQEEINKSNLPALIWSFQQPTYLYDKDQQLYAYTCEDDRDECKVNMDFRDSFPDDVRGSDYRCEIDFGFETWEEQKCNPNTIVFGIGIHDIYIKIFDKGTHNIVASKHFSIDNQNWAIDKIIEEEMIKNIHDSSQDTQIVGKQKDTTENQDKIIVPISEEAETYEVPEIIVSLQRPSYVIEDLWLYTCDNNREECKINLDFRDSFSELLPERDYICEIDFWFETWQEHKCNPNTIIFSEWTHEVNIKIIHEDDRSRYSEKKILIQNDGYKQVEQQVSKTVNTQTVSEIYISKPKIEIQSWLEMYGGSYKCKKSTCKVNLKYEPKSSNEKCEWRLSGAIWYTEWTQQKCNPGYIEYPYGIFQIRLEIYQKQYINNRKYAYLSFENREQVEAVIEKETEKIIEEENEDIKDNSSVSIFLQGKVGKWKTLEQNVLKCYWVDKCYANFIAEWDFLEDEYIWDFWNNETYIWKNPKWIWFVSWEHKISLKIREQEKYFYIYVYQDQLEIQDVLEVPEFLSDENKASQILSSQRFSIYDYSALSIHAVSPNPKWNDIKEWLEIRNNGLEDINLRWCEIDDDIWKGSRNYKIKEDLFLKPWEIRRFYKVFIKLNLNNAWDSVNVICNEGLVDSLSWDFKISDNLVLSHQYPQWRISTRKDVFYSDHQYREFVENTFIQKQRLLKSGFKISGETLPNTRIRIILWNNMKDIYMLTDNNWLYEALLETGLIPANIKIQVEVLTDGETFLFEHKDEIELTSQYIQSLIKIKKKKKQKKVVSKKPKTYFLSVANASSWDPIKKETPFGVLLLFLITILWFLSLFLIMKKGNLS